MTEKKDSDSKGLPPRFILAVPAKLKELYPGGDNPQGDSGIDLKTPADIEIPAGAYAAVVFGISAVCVVNGKKEQFSILPRSSFGKIPLLALGGFLAPDKTEMDEKTEILVMNVGKEPFTIAKGTSLFQLVEKYLRAPTYQVVDTIPADLPLCEGARFPRSVLASQQAKRDPDHLVRQLEYLLCPSKDVEALYSKLTTAVIYMPKTTVFEPNATTDIDTGVKVCCMSNVGPEAFYMHADFPNDLLALKNWVGVIDRGYRGTLRAKVYNAGKTSVTIERGARIFCLGSYFTFEPTVTLVSADHAQFAPDATLRGERGFGSTGAAGQK
jgi:dUTPase